MQIYGLIAVAKLVHLPENHALRFMIAVGKDAQAAWSRGERLLDSTVVIETAFGSGIGYCWYLWRMNPLACPAVGILTSTVSMPFSTLNTRSCSEFASQALRFQELSQLRP